MEPQRFLHIIRARWWVIALFAVLGAAAAASFARTNNNAIEPVYEAEASINLTRLTNEREDLFEGRLESVRGQAEVALQTELADDSLTVYASPATGRVVFRATAGNEIEAERLARDLRAAYLVAGPIVSDADQVAATLRDLRADIEELEVEIALLLAPDPIDPDVEALRLQLEAEIARLRQQAASLKLQIKYPDLFPPVGIPPDGQVPPEELPLLTTIQLQRQLDALEVALVGLEAELAALGPAPNDAVSNDLEVLVLQRQLTDLEERYVELSVQLVAVEAGDSAVDPFVPVIDRTPTPQPMSSAGFVGLFAGGMLAMVGLLLLDRSRRPLLMVDDVADYSPLGSVDRRRRGDAALPWYPQGASTRRRQQIQVARGSLEKVIGDVPSTVLVSGVSVGQLDTRELAADLAGAFAATGRRVLLIDASLEEGPYLPEYDQMGPSLVELLNEGVTGGTEELSAAIKTTFVEREPVLPGLVSMPVGGHGRDPVDLFAGTRYRLFLDVAMTEFDLVLVAAPEIDDPAANTFAQRSKFVVLVTGAWRTTEADLERSLATLGRTDGSVSVAMLEGRNGSQLSQIPGRSIVTSTARKAAKVGFSVVDLVLPRFPGPRILIYHQVGSNLDREMEVTTANFEKQIEWLQDRGEIVDLASAVSRRGEPDSDRIFVLTFDDGFEDVYDNAFPVLRDRGIPFVLYLSTLPIETGEPLNLHYPEARPLMWDQINEMIESGLVAVGAHTHTHPDLRTLNADDVWREITISDDLIEERTGIRPLHFTYPWGYWSSTANRLVEENYESATLGAGQPADESASPYTLNRFPVQRSDGFWLFKRRVIGGFRLEDRIRRQLRDYQGP